MSLKAWIAKKAIEGKLPNWAYRLIGKRLAKKLHWGDKMADQLPTKPWYQSKAVWAAIVTAFLGAVQPVSAAMGHPIAVPLWIIEVLTGLGLYGLRTATTTIGS